MNFAAKVTTEGAQYRKRYHGVSVEPSDRKLKLGKVVLRRSDLTTPAQRQLCCTRKYLTAFKGYIKWVYSRPLQDLMNSQWNVGAEVKDFQSFRLPFNGRSLLLTSQKRGFRSDKGLCPNCGNYKNDDGNACTLHPLNEHVQLDSRTILGVDLQKITTVPEVSALSISSLERAEHIRDQNIALLHSVSNLVHERISTTVEGMTPDNSWLTTKVGIGANNQRSYVARSFVQKHNLGAMITRHLTRLVTKVHFHGTSITSNEVLCTRLRIEEQVMLVIAYIVDELKNGGVILGNDTVDSSKQSIKFAL